MGAQPAYSHRNDRSYSGSRSYGSADGGLGASRGACSYGVREPRSNRSGAPARSTSNMPAARRSSAAYDSRTSRAHVRGGAPARAFDGSAARAYDALPDRAPQSEPRIRVVTGSGPQNAPAVLPSSVHLFARIAIAVIVAFALVGVVRVYLSSATVTASVTAKELSSKIDSARAEGNQLEVAQSSLSNPARVKSEANAMGMAAPAETTVIALDDDVVALDAQGSLSLSKTLQGLADAAGA